MNAPVMKWEMWKVEDEGQSDMRNSSLPYK